MRAQMQLKSKRILGFVLCLAIVSTACPGNDSKAKRIAKVSDDVAQGLLSAANLLADAKAAGNISQEDIDFLKPYLKSVGESNLQAIKVGRTLSTLDDIPIDKQEEILQIISFVSDTLTTLNNEGTLRIKNPEKRAIFSAFILAAQTSATSIVIILNLRKGGK